MNSISLKIKDTILDVIKREDEEMNNLHNKGIFFLPELAITYLIGKELVRKSVEIFKSNIVNWYPEYSLGRGRPFDLVLILENDKKYVFEFKTRQTSESYIEDINKLHKLDSSEHEKYFCAFVDCFEKISPNDERITTVENSCGTIIERVSEDNSFKIFKTKDHARVNQVVCVLGLWKIK